MSTDEKPSKRIKLSLKDFSSSGNFQNTLCKYIHRHCFQERIHGYDFCIRHILEDKNAPFRQCTYIQQSHKKKCTNAAPKTDKNDRREALCPFHAKQSLLKTKSPSYKRKVVKGPKALLRSLEHYCKNPHHDPVYSKEAGIAEKYETAPCDTHCPPSLRPLSEFDVNEKGSSEKITGHLDTFEDHRDWELSSRDLLRHAGVFTGKEVIALARDKAMRLKTLYVDELKRTYYQLKELRREYLREMKTETRKNAKLSASKAKMLHNLESYHSPFGIDKIMRRKSEEKRMGIIPQKPTCVFIQNGRKCSETAIVCTSYCLKHILSDPNQCLFVPCSITSKKKCDIPVLPIMTDFSVCKLHLYTALLPESKEGQGVSSTETTAEQEHFQSMDDIASLELDDIASGSLFGLDQEAECVNTFFRNSSWSSIKFESNFGEPSESTDTVMSEEQVELMEIQPITLNPPADILSDGRKSDIEEEK